MRLASSVVESMRDSRTQLSIGDFQVHAMLELLDDLAQARWEGARYFSDTWWRSPRVYFAFVERSEPIQRVRARGRPGGDVQFTAVGVQPFFALSRQITPLDHEDVSSEQRQNRAGELRRFLGNVPIVSLEFGQFGRLPPGLQIQEGEWWIVGYQPGAQAQATVEIRFPGIDADVQDGGGMTLLTPITARWRRPLRDIFSLVHVPDANFEERPEGVPVASPAPDSPSAAIVDWAPSRGMREA
jgi:hypothetical protein